MATSTSKIFSLEAKGLKLDTAADVEPHIRALRDMKDVEEVRFLGNTLGVEACEAIAKVLEEKKSLKVCPVVFLMRKKYTKEGDKTNLFAPQDRKPCRYIHRPTSERNPTSTLFAAYCAAKTPESAYG
jgi:hypothetical protein